MARLEMKDATRTEPVKPRPFMRGFVTHGIARCPKGYQTVTVKFDADGKQLDVRLGQPQSFSEYVTLELKRLVHAAAMKP